MKPDAPPQDPSSVNPGSSSLSTGTMVTTTKSTGPTPLFPVDGELMFDLFVACAALTDRCVKPVLTCSSAVSEVLGNAAKEPPEGPPAPQDGKNSKGTKTSTRLPLPSSALLTPPLFLFAAPSVQQRSQLEELRKFGKEFRVITVVT